MARSVLITGCSTGIGYHAAQHLHANGWQVIAGARKQSDVERLQEGGLAAVHLDYCDEASLLEAVDFTLENTGGRLDALFNNGAYGQVGALEDISTQAIRDQFEANFFGWHTLTQAILPTMRAQSHGRIVQCSSVLGFIAAPYRGPYTASKYAIEGYSDTLRSEVAPFGIRVISIQPGPITSQFRANALAMFEQTVDWENSAYGEDYTQQRQRLHSREKASFELGPEAVTRALQKAIESPNPRPVYRVTTPTHAMALAKRILPTRTLANMMAKGRNR